VTAVNDAPTVTASGTPTSGIAPLAVNFTATGADADGDTLTYVIVANPAHGTLSGAAPSVTYTPAANYNGTDSFTFRASDGKTNSNVATVSITVTAVNDAPAAMLGVDPATGSVTNEFYFWATESYDVDGTIVGSEWRINGALVTTNAEFLYTFATGGTYTVVLTVWDNAGASGSDTMVVNVSDATTPVVSVSVLDGVAGEPGLATGSGRFQVRRIGDLTQPLTVNYAMSGTASNGVDYTLVSGTATLAAGEASRTVVVDPLPDALAEGTEMAILTLLPGTGYAEDEELSAGTIIIQDQTYGTPVVTAVATDAIATEPKSGIATDKGAIKISRTGSCEAALTVQVTVSGTAVNGVDYMKVTVPVVLAVGQSAKTISIVPYADAVVDPNETVILTVQSNAAYTIGAGQSTGTVTIRE
jgi:PKD repeat protein